MEPGAKQELEIRPMAGAMGAEIGGVDLAAPMARETLAALRRAIVDHGVVVLREQSLSREAQLAFAKRLGKPEVHPIAKGMGEHPEIIRVLKPQGERASFGTGWHTDNSFFESPSSFTVLYGENVPGVGGDTLFASMERAYAALSEPIRTLLRPLQAIHSASSAYDPRVTGEAKYNGDAAITYTYSEAIYDEVSHPVVRTHPESGRQSLYVNAMFTQRIEGLAAHESDALLRMLYTHLASPDFQCRVRWAAGTVTMWDNRCVQHYALDDYPDEERLMYRVTIEGERPV